jgi:hypothetical protein
MIFFLGIMVGTLASYSEVASLSYWRGEAISWVRYFLVFLRPSTKTLGVHIVSSHGLFFAK